MEHEFYLEEKEEKEENNGNELFNIIHKIDSRDIIYKPDIKYSVLGSYIKGDLLGEGSYGKVKECVNLKTLQRCAVKIMKRRTLRRIPNGEKNVQQEIKLIRNLNHKNVIKLIDVFQYEEKQKIYMVMEYCIIGLQQMIESTNLKKFPTWQAHKYFLQLIEGLEYIHCKGIIHKDIKPGNLLLTTSHTLKIIDFGVAEKISHYSENDLITTSQGSPVFQPPEVAGGLDKFPGFKLDVWSSGVTLYNLTSGSYPFDGTNVFRLYESICTDPVNIPENLDPSLQELLGLMLIKDPYERISVCAIKCHRWFLKKLIQTGNDEVPLIPKPSDLGFSVIDAVRIHFYENDQILSDSELSTEHDINGFEQELKDQQEIQEKLQLSYFPTESVVQEENIPSKPDKNNKSKKRKPFSCIQLKGIPKCSQS